MDSGKTDREKGTPWETTSIQNLIRYRPSGTYFARFKIGRKLFRQSLATKVLSTAKLRLRDKIHEHRLKAAAGNPLKAGRITVAEAMKVYLEKVENNPSLKPRSKEYLRTVCGFIQRTWPDLERLDAKKVTERDCEQWLSGIQSKYSATLVNNAIGTIRNIFQVPVDAGLRFNNPAEKLKKQKVKSKKLCLPSKDQFQQFVETIASGGARQSQDCADLVRFLAFTGLRITEAGAVTWKDVNFERKDITVRGDPGTGTKNGEVRIVPMIPQLFDLLTGLRALRSMEPHDTPVMRVKHCQHSMDRAAALVGMDRITHHDLRHLFATVCIENGCDVPTVSRWLGHKDGGALCMKTYGHLRRDHSVKQAGLVNF